eukprot:TRINITY_DN48123_c0_g1_i1.p1 TRINITY_DN48123_c0_g1~~TRINITY_DN48123_c0_g1_i1.p1  ORF type:complete len:794 (-),score=100.55 TRINITY_DN48123_c0_g1_i1:10-2391(-)
MRDGAAIGNPPAKQPSDSMILFENCSEEFDHTHDRQKIICLFLVSVVAVVLALVVSRLPVANYAVIVLGQILGIVLFVVYVVLRFAHVLGPRSLGPFCAFLAWLLALLISLSPPSRQEMLGWGEGAATIKEPCEDGTGAFWIGLLLVFVSALGSLEALPVCVLGQFIAVQHFVVDILLPRSECAANNVPRGVVGPLLGLSPALVSACQLSCLTFLLAAMRPPQSRQRSLDRYIKMADSAAPTTDVTISGWIENLINEIEFEEERCRDLFFEVGGPVWISSAAPVPADWLAVAKHLVSVLTRCGLLLRNHETDGHGKSLHEKVVEAASRESGEAASYVREYLEGTESHLGRDLTTCVALTRHSNVDFNLGEWSFDALGVERERGNVLQLVGKALLPGVLNLPHGPLIDFLARLEGSYISANPYHSHVHAADMCNALFYLLRKGDLWEQRCLSRITRLSILLAALGHDVGHLGRNNLFLINQRHALAVTYNDHSVLENFHSATLTRLLDDVYGDEGSSMKLLSSFMPEDVITSRQLRISLILATDTQKHLEALSSFRVRLGAESFEPLEDPKDRQEVLAMFFRSADIGHSAKEWELHQAWSLRVVQEFHEQGDHEKQLGMKVSPLCERKGASMPSGQMGFLQFICLPTWTELSRFEELMLLKTPTPQSSGTTMELGFTCPPGTPAGAWTDESLHSKKIRRFLSETGVATDSGELRPFQDRKPSRIWSGEHSTPSNRSARAALMRKATRCISTSSPVAVMEQRWMSGVLEKCESNFSSWRRLHEEEKIANTAVCEK